MCQMVMLFARTLSDENELNIIKLIALLAVLLKEMPSNFTCTTSSVFGVAQLWHGIYVTMDGLKMYMYDIEKHPCDLTDVRPWSATDAGVCMR